MSSRSLYTGDGTQDTFPITFPYIKIEHVVVYVDGSVVTWTLSSGSAVLDTAPADGASVVIARETPYAAPLVSFGYTTPTTPESLTLSQLQSLYAVEDLAETLGGLPYTGLGSDEIPLPVVTDRLLVSRPDGEGGFSWQSLSLDEVVPLLTDLPAPTEGFTLLGTNESGDGDGWRLYTSSEAADLLGTGGGTGIPSINISNAFLMSNAAGDSYTLNSYATVFTGLGLGTAAKKNTGTAVGNVITIEDVPDVGAGLPAIDGSQLTGMGESDYARLEVFSEDAPNMNGLNLTAGVQLSEGPDAGAWVAVTGDPTTGFILQPGKYRIDVECHYSNNGTGRVRLYSSVISGTASPTEMVGHASDSKASGLLRGRLNVTAAAEIRIMAEASGGATLGKGSHSFGTRTSPSVSVLVWKLSS